MEKKVTWNLDLPAIASAIESWAIAGWKALEGAGITGDRLMWALVTISVALVARRSGSNQAIDRLKLNSEVYEYVPSNHLNEWDEMIERDVRSVIDKSYHVPIRKWSTLILVPIAALLITPRAYWPILGMFALAIVIPTVYYLFSYRELVAAQTAEREEERSLRAAREPSKHRPARAFREELERSIDFECQGLATVCLIPLAWVACHVISKEHDLNAVPATIIATLILAAVILGPVIRGISLVVASSEDLCERQPRIYRACARIALSGEPRWMTSDEREQLLEEWRASPELLWRYPQVRWRETLAAIGEVSERLSRLGIRAPRNRADGQRRFISVEPTELERHEQ